MPVVAVNLPATAFREITELVARGEYASPESFLTTAAFNQLALERGAKPAALMPPVKEDLSPTPPPVGRLVAAEGVVVQGVEAIPRTLRVKERAPAAAREALSRLPRGRSHGGTDSQASELRERLALPSEGLPYARPLAHESSGGTAAERVWGQVNRLFPIKFAVRWLAQLGWERLGDQAGRWLGLADVQERIARDAALMGSYLEKADQQAGRQRDEQLATGLPRLGNSASQDRFVSQIIARTTRSGDVYPGAIYQYGLAEFDDGHIGLTKEGMQLAALRNPILDEADEAGALLEPERDFFLFLTRQYLQGEARELRRVLRSVLDGHATPDSLHAAVRPTLPDEWTAVMARTHITGLVSRAAELGLLLRRWLGRNVSYEVTAVGNTFVQEGAAS